MGCPLAACSLGDGAATSYTGCSDTDIDRSRKYALAPGGYGASLSTSGCRCDWFGVCWGCTAKCFITKYDRCCPGFEGSGCDVCVNRNCPAEQYRVGDCTISTNTYSCRLCANIVCPAGQVRSGSCTSGTRGYTCRACRNAVCPAGSYRSGFCGGQTDGFTCQPCSSATCRADEYRVGNCGGTTNGWSCRKCSNTVCPVGTFRSGTCNGVTKGYTCLPCEDKPCPRDSYQTGQCGGATTPELNTLQCVRCGNSRCPVGFFRGVGVCDATTRAFSCEKCSNSQCSPGFYRSGSCAGSSPTENGFKCNACGNTTCPAGTFRSGICNEAKPAYLCSACTNAQCGPSECVCMRTLPERPSNSAIMQVPLWPVRRHNRRLLVHLVCGGLDALQRPAKLRAMPAGDGWQ